MSQVKVTVGGDDVPFHKMMNRVEKRLHGLKEFTHIGLKEQLVGLVGAGSIGVLVESMMHWAEATERASKNMGIAIDQVQKFQTISRHAGVDLEFFGSAFNKVNQARVEALTKGTKGDKQKGLFHSLGVTDDQLQHLNKVDLTKAALKGTVGMDDSTAQATLNKIFGKGAGGVLLGNRKEILDSGPLGPGVDAQTIEKMAKLKMELDDLQDVVKSKVIPALVGFAEAALSIFHWVVKHVEIGATGIRVASDTAEKNGISKKQQSINAANMLLSPDKFLANAIKNDKKAVWSEIFGDKGAAAGISAQAEAKKEIQDQDVEYEKRKAAREAAFIAEQKRLNGPINAHGLPEAAAKPMKSLLDHALKSDNSFLKIGGLSGVDTDYRLVRIEEKANEYLAQIVKNTGGGSDDDKEDMDPYDN